MTPVVYVHYQSCVYFHVSSCTVAIRDLKVTSKWLFTFDLDVPDQHRFDLFAPHQDASGPPIQDVHARLQTHLEVATDTGSGEDSPSMRKRETLPSAATHRVCSPLAVVGDFDPLLVVALHHLLTLFVLDLDTKPRGHAETVGRLGHMTARLQLLT